MSTMDRVSKEHYTELPAHLRETLELYIEHRIPTGSFMEAVLSNDLREAFGRADYINRKFIEELVKWLYWHAPAACWGSKAAVDEWLRR